MPLKVRRLWVSCLVLTAAASGGATASAQQAVNQTSSAVATTSPVAAAPAATATNSAQQKITKVRALIAARNFGAAANELEKIKRESADAALKSVASVMLMSVYLEQPDYNRAQTLLEESFKNAKNNKIGAEAFFAVAGQVIKSSQSQLERYKRLGINISDANLPVEAAGDLNKWHSLLELIVTDSKQMSLEAAKNQKQQPAESLALLEAATNARGTLARDEYESAKWKNELNDTRELMASAQTKVEEVDASAAPVNVSAPSNALIASNTPTATVFKQPAEQPKVIVPVAVAANQPQPTNNNQSQTLNQQPAPVVEKPAPNNAVAEQKTEQPQQPSTTASTDSGAANNNSAKNKTDKPANEPIVVKSAAKTETKASGDGLIQVGSLVDAATRKVSPMYPPLAKTARITGVVKVEVVLDENGKVAEVRNAAGPEMLRHAAMEAVKRWQFKPFTRDGQAVRASGFVNFNFTL